MKKKIVKDYKNIYTLKDNKRFLLKDIFLLLLAGIIYLGITAFVMALFK